MAASRRVPCILVVLLALAIARCDSAPPGDLGGDYVLGCTILGRHGEVVRSFPAAKACVFMDDGSFIASTNDPMRLARIGPTGKIVWSRGLHIHHQLKLSADKKRILTLGSDIRDGDLGRVRYDDVLILSADTGETLYRWSGYEHRLDYLKYNTQVPTKVREPGSRENLDYLYEYTHFNSVDEIPENPTAKAIPAFAKGNVLVGMNGIGTFAILDPELKGVIWTMPDPLVDGDAVPNTRAFHDLQILPNGHLLLFNNIFGSSVESAHFELREIDPVSVKTVWSYPSDSARVAVGGAGGVQILPDGVLFNANAMVGGQESGGAFFIDSSGKTRWTLEEIGDPGAWKYILSVDDVGHLKTRGDSFQDIKRMNVSEFLKHNRL